jgi:hypothetical protein
MTENLIGNLLTFAGQGTRDGTIAQRSLGFVIRTAPTSWLQLPFTFPTFDGTESDVLSDCLSSFHAYITATVKRELHVN